MRKLFFPVFLVSVALFASTIYSQRLENPIKVVNPVSPENPARLENPIRLENPVRLETPIKIAHPDFSGRWQLNPTKSKFDKSDQPGLAGIPFHLIIDHKDPLISVLIASPFDPAPTKKGAALDFAWYTDGRVIWNPGFENGVTATRWQDRKMITDHYDDEFRKNVLQTEEVEVGPDGNTILLTIKIYLFFHEPRIMKNLGYTEINYLIFDRVNGPMAEPLTDPKTKTVPRNSAPGARKN
jgi:hypothetical protein